MARMIAIGPERLALPFGALGFEMVEADRAGFAEAFESLARDSSVGLIVCGESFVDPADEEFRELSQTTRAAVLVVPDGPDAQGIGMNLVKKAIERAAGVDLLGATEAEPDSQ